MKDYLFDALGEISDSHITEAAEYKPKIKVLNLKRVISLAACLAVVAVSVFAVSNYVFPDFTEPSTELITWGTTTVAGTQDSNVQCVPTVKKWEQRDYCSRFSDIEISGKKYDAYQPVQIGENRIGAFIGEVECKGTDENSAVHTANAEIFEIKGVSADGAAAVRFKDDTEKLYYVYFQKNFLPENLGEMMDKFNFSENFAVGEAHRKVSYNADGENLGSEYVMDDEVYEAFTALLKNGREAKAETADTEYSSENLRIWGSVLGHTCVFNFTKEGYLFLSIGSNTVRYNTGVQAYRSFLSLVKTKEAAEITKGIDVLTTTSHTTAMTSQGYTVEIPSDYEERSSDIPVTSPAYIPEGMKTEIQPEIHLFSTAPAKSYDGWETWDFSSCYHQISINGVTYTADTINRIPVSSEKLGSVLYEFEWEDYRYLKKNDKSFTVVIYEVKGTDKEKAVAVGRKDGLQGGYFLYSAYIPDPVGDLKSCKTLGDYCEKSVYYFSVQSSSWVTYEQDGKEDTIYSLGYEARNLIIELIESNADKKAEIRTSSTGERLQFDTAFYNVEDVISAYLCSDGYFYISCGTEVRAFNIGTYKYNKFMKKFKGTTCIWTPEHPCTIG